MKSLLAYAKGQRPAASSQSTAAPAASVSDRIIRAGQVRRGEVESARKPTGTALAIVNAGRRARNEPPL